MTQFKTARPVWLMGYESEMNISAQLYDVFEATCSQRCVLRIAGASFYKVYLNGAFVHFGPARAGHGCVRVDELDLTGHLQPGENHLAIEIVGYNCRCFNGVATPSFLQAELLLDEALCLYTGRDFRGALNCAKQQKVMRYSYQRQFSEVYAYGRPEEAHAWRAGELQAPVALTPVKLDVKYFERGVPQPRYDIVPFREVICGGRAVKKADPAGIVYAPSRFVDQYELFDGFRLEELSGAPIREYASYDYTNEAVGAGARELDAGRYLTLDMGVNNTGFIRSQLQVHEDARVWVIFGETLQYGRIDPSNDHENTNIIQYDLKRCAGSYELESSEVYGFKYISYIVVSGRVELKGCALREYSNPETENTLLTCDDEKLMAVFEAAKNTYRHNTVDLFMDCPTRERAGWLCDSYYMGQAAQIFSGNARVEKAFLENYLYAPEVSGLPPGMLPMCYPADMNGEWIPQWAMWFVVQLEQYLNRDPKADKELYKSKSYALLNYLSAYENEDGLLERLENWNFVEWSKANEWVQDVNYPTNMLYAKALDVVGSLYGDSELIDKAQALREDIIQQSFDGSFFVDNAVRGESGALERSDNRSEVCQYYAFCFDVVSLDDPRFESLIETILHVFGPNRVERGLLPEIEPANALMGIYMRLELLERMGRYRQLIDEIKTYFYPMAEQTGTLWEHNQLGGSQNHGFASYAAVSIVKALTGLKDIDERNQAVECGNTDCAIPCKVRIGLIGGEISFERNGDGSKVEIPDAYLT